jgi:integrase
MGGVRKRTKVKGLWVTQAKRAGAGGYYSARLRDKVTGKPKWVPLGTDYEAAKKKLYEHRAGAPIPSRITLKDAVAGWLTYLESKRPNEKDRKLAKVRTEQYLLKHFNPDIRLGSLTREHVLRYRAWLDKRTAKAWRSPEPGSEKPEAKKLSPLTVAHILSDFRALLKWCEITGRVDRSPFVSRLVMPRIAEKAPKGLSPVEIAKLTSLPGDYGWTWRFLIGSGLRWGEATRARADHVHDGVLLVEKAKGKRVRRVPLTDGLLDEIEGRVGLLVPFTAAGSFARTSRKESGLPNIHPHQARHTYAMAWLDEGGSLAALQEVLGHQNLTTTQVYARVTDDLVRREAARVYAQKNRVPGAAESTEKERQKGA